jgi:hypothetical protein
VVNDDARDPARRGSSLSPYRRPASGDVAASRDGESTDVHLPVLVAKVKLPWTGRYRSLAGRNTESAATVHAAGVADLRLCRRWCHQPMLRGVSDARHRPTWCIDWAVCGFPATRMSRLRLCGLVRSADGVYVFRIEVGDLVRCETCGRYATVLELSFDRDVQVIVCRDGVQAVGIAHQPVQQRLLASHAQLQASLKGRAQSHD